MSASDQSQQRIFVSHSHADTAYCREYVASLRARGYYVWYDEHNLGWGALRATIEREMPTCQHFVAILSPAAVASEWVNTEIDAALELLSEETLQTFTFVVAETCDVPLLLRRWKRIEGSGGAPVGVAEAVARTAQTVVSERSHPITRQSAAPITRSPEQSSDLQSIATAPTQIDPRRVFWLPGRLAQLGFTAHHKDNMLEYIAPPVCKVPAGPFLMGSNKHEDPQASEDELPQHSVALETFQIAKYPVTVAEYACFVRATKRMEPRGLFNDLSWTQQISQRLDHPVVNISWRDAVAYAKWLAQCTGHPWRLPSEAEWEKAGRGTDGRIYPWGDLFDAAQANTVDGERGGTTSIGSYPSGTSPYGALDMAGNVWEWTSSIFKPYPYIASDGREQIESTGDRVLRGGSWAHLYKVARVAYRNDSQLNYLYVGSGFRVAYAVSSS